MDGHQTVFGVPFDEQCLLDAQAEDDRLVGWPGRLPRFGRAAVMVVAGLYGSSRQFEFTLAAVGGGHGAVQRVSRVLPQVVYLLRPRHGADEQLARNDARLDGADARRCVTAQRAQQRHAWSVQARRAEPGNWMPRSA